MGLTVIERKYKKHLHRLTTNLDSLIAKLDNEMRKPESPMRGRNLARIANAMDMENDYAMRYGLDMSFEKIANLKQNHRR